MAIIQSGDMLMMLTPKMEKVIGEARRNEKKRIYQSIFTPAQKVLGQDTA